MPKTQDSSAANASPKREDAPLPGVEGGGAIEASVAAADATFMAASGPATAGCTPWAALITCLTLLV